MARYIDLKKAIEAIMDLPNCPNGYSDTYDKECIIGILEEVPTADVVERKRGKWEITDAFPHIVYCGVCHKRYAQTQWQVWKDGTLPRNFCPNCGAEMEANDG